MNVWRYFVHRNNINDNLNKSRVTFCLSGVKREKLVTYSFNEWRKLSGSRLNCSRGRQKWERVGGDERVFQGWNFQVSVRKHARVEAKNTTVKRRGQLALDWN